MKIAFFVSLFPSLSETFILNQITGLINRGHVVHVYALKVDFCPKIVHTAVVKYNIMNNVYPQGSCPEIMPKNLPARLLKIPNLITGNFRRNTLIFIRSLNFHALGRQALSLRVFFEAQPFLDNGASYDVIHCHFGPNGKLASRLKRLGVLSGKVVTTFHGYDLSKYMKQYGPNVYKTLFESGDLFLPISNHLKRELIHMGCHPSKVTVHHMGIDTNNIEFVPRCPKNGQTIVVLTVARLVNKKGIAYGIQAVAKAQKRFKNLRYFIIGDGPLRSNLENLITTLNMSNSVKIVGWKSQDKVQELMKTADLLLAPSITDSDGDQEGIPVALIEAMAHGLPVISTYHSGIPELVKDGIFGFLAPERDVTALADRLIYLITHQNLWTKMSQAGREHVESHYDIEKLNNRLVTLYEGLPRTS